MCLKLKYRKKDTISKIAKRNIIVYKFLFLREDGYITPYMHTYIEIGKLYESKLIYNDEYNIVEIGLHSYKYRRSAIKISKESYQYGIWEIKDIIKCIIPKGSKYYKGTHSGKISYVSNKLKYIKKIKRIKD